MSENAFWLALWLGLAVTLGGSVTAMFVADAYRDCKAMELGYSRKAVPGWSSPVWTREDER